MLIETQRLLLRDLEPDDADAIVEFCQDCEFNRYRLRSQRSEAVTRRCIHQGILAATLVPRTYYSLAIVLKPSALNPGTSVIGTLTLSLAWNPQLWGNIGFEVSRPLWGRGYATEAAYAVLELSFHQLGVAVVTADCFAANRASIRVMEKIGMRRSTSWKDPIALAISYGEIRPMVRHQIRSDEWRYLLQHNGLL